MTMKQKKGIRTAVLAILFVLLVIGTFFDSRHGNLAVRAESKAITSEGDVDLRRKMDTPPVERMAISQAVPDAPVRTAPMEKTNEVKNAQAKKVEVPAVREVQQKVTVVKDIREPVRAEPAPNPWNYATDGEDDYQLAKKPVPVPNPVPNPGLTPDPDHDQTPEVGKNSEKDHGSSGDRNRGHGNDEDRYDEDNPGRGGTDGVSSSRGSNGHRASGSRGVRGKCGRRGGSKKR